MLGMFGPVCMSTKYSWTTNVHLKYNVKLKYLTDDNIRLRYKVNDDNIVSGSRQRAVDRKCCTSSLYDIPKNTRFDIIDYIALHRSFVII